MLTWFAHAYARAGQVERALEYLREAEDEHARTDARNILGWLNVLRGKFLFQNGLERAEEAESCLRKALERATGVGMVSHQLKAALHLGRLLSRLGRRQEAVDVLAPVYGRYTEGFSRPDMVEARALLENLSQAT